MHECLNASFLKVDAPSYICWCVLCVIQFRHLKFKKNMCHVLLWHKIYARKRQRVSRDVTCLFSFFSQLGWSPGAPFTTTSFLSELSIYRAVYKPCEHYRISDMNVTSITILWLRPYLWFATFIFTWFRCRWYWNILWSQNSCFKLLSIFAQYTLS